MSGGNQSMINAMDILNSTNKSFIFVNINLSVEEKEAINLLKFQQSLLELKHNLSYYGVFNENRLSEMIAEYFIGSKNKSTISNIFINKIIKPYLLATKCNSLWFTIRIFTSNDEFTVPRWHTDGNFYVEPENKNQYKMAGVLLGPGTLFKESSDFNFIDLHREVYKNFDLKNWDNEIDIENRKIIDNALSKYQIVEPNNDEVAIFAVGNNKPAIHSEPDMSKIDRVRIFYSVVSGSEDNIKNLAKRLNRTFIS
ncbi:MAG: hypothetical protein Satyrvirus8_5 [Satyrvirus sp.]|uniref:Uncharacterized protein n=1 Tax=Satyrvirus sp. TaxID=2487771 RepID=A0A3G5ADK2_9VIRU|nr:MAG: hypothetical protein Satyrvirus8_5 [Satyrvirus sp.]